MKFDRYTPLDALTRNQAYFAGCWLNMVHEHSLDSYRVSTMNCRNILREIRRIYALGKPDERAMVRAEAHHILSTDLVLRGKPFKAPTGRLIQLLSPKGPVATSKEEGGQPIALVMYFISELEEIIEAQYLEKSLDLLKEILVERQDRGDQPEVERFDEIFLITGYLLSTLIDKKWSIESLYALYSEILVPRRLKPSSMFERRLEVCRALLTQPAVEHRIVMSLDNVTSTDGYPAEIGGITFSTEPPFMGDEKDGSPAAKRAVKYLVPARRRLFATLSIKAQDPRTAGAEAANILGDVLNLVRFEYERGKIEVPEYFVFIVPSKPRGPRAYSLPVVVPNPTSSMDGDGLAAFVASVDELVVHGRFVGEGSDRVKSAFRLYRVGLDSSVLENKLVNWWTAIEYLVRGGTSNAGGIGKSVENMLTPVLCKTYISKHVLAVRSLLLELGAVLLDPQTREPVALKGMSVDQVYLMLKHADVQSQVLTCVRGHAFLERTLIGLFAELTDPKALNARNERHEKRLRWHLQRLWRARCDIVHSAERTVSAALLCANLEYYLKSTLMALLRALREIPTLSGPKEFFDRQALAYELIQRDLQDGHEQELLLSMAG